MVVLHESCPTVTKNYGYPTDMSHSNIWATFVPQDLVGQLCPSSDLVPPMLLRGGRGLAVKQLSNLMKHSWIQLWHIATVGQLSQGLTVGQLSSDVTVGQLLPDVTV